MEATKSKYRGKPEYFLVHSELTSAAQYHGTLTYDDIVDIMGLPHNRFTRVNVVGNIVGEISEDEHEQGRPMLSALVVGVQRGAQESIPGQGFFGLATYLGLLPEGASKDAQMEFWKKQLKEVYETWQRVPRRLKKPSL